MRNEFFPSVSESNAFGLQVFRTKISSIDTLFIEENFFAVNIDVIISRIDTQVQTSLFTLLKLIPHSYLADTLVYYSCNIEHCEKNLLSDNIRIVKAGVEHRKTIEYLITTIFIGYKNHYHSNPLFSSVDLAKGYLEWNLPFLNDPDKMCLILFDNDIPCAFLTAKIYADEGFADIILNGVLKEYEGQGKYSFLLRELKCIMSESNISKLIVSTQLTNQRVQKVWSKENFVLDKSYYTFHHFISENSIQKLNKAS